MEPRGSVLVAVHVLVLVVGGEGKRGALVACGGWMDGWIRSGRSQGKCERRERLGATTARNGQIRFTRRTDIHGLRLGGDVGRTVESLAAAGQRGRGRVPVVAAVEHVLDAVTLLAVEDGLPSLGKLTAARKESGGKGRSTKIQILRARSGRNGGRAAVGFGGDSLAGSGHSLLADVGEAHGDASKDATVAVRRARGALGCG